MASFTFDAHGTTVTGHVEEIKSGIIGRKAFAAKAKCPFCQKELKAGYGMGDRKSQSEVKSTIKTNMKAHIKTQHRK